MRGAKALLAVVLLQGCSGEFDAAPTEGETIEVVCNITLSQLHSRFVSGDYLDIDEDWVLRGSVTANDKASNFYKSFMIESDGAALEILEGLTYNYVRYQEGNVVAINLNGLRLYRSRGVLQVGIEGSAGGYVVDYLGHELLVDRHIVNTGVVESVEPQVVTLTDDVGDKYGCLVTIEGLTFQPEDESDTWGGTRCFVDSEGSEVMVYTNSYSNYSLMKIPSEQVSLTGILQCDDGDLYIKMRGEDDCKVM